MKLLSKEFAKGEMQEELKMVISQTPPEFREIIERQEADVAGLRKTPDGYERMNGIQASADEILSLNNNVNTRMLNESPALREHKVVLRGGKLSPDFALHEREMEVTKW
tara:strand:- start:341 stop:667 length:327 start_codon:yes stop_codon:yes gene_type:complete